MSIKRKLILMGICVVIIITVLSVNVVRRLKQDKSDRIVDNNNVTENAITRAEAFRLLSYLEYDKEKREAVPFEITYADKQMSDWYDSYVNAAWKMGLIEGNVAVSPKEALTYGSCKDMIDKLITKNPVYQSVYTGLSFEFTKSENKMQLPEFLEIYRALLAAVPKENIIVKEESMLVLGKEAAEDKQDRMITDLGKYYYLDAKSYENEKVASETKADLADQYMDKGIKALVCGQEIVYIESISAEKIIVHMYGLNRAGICP
jgi:stage II sporulation protein D